MPQINALSLTPGTTVYISVWGYNGSTGTFGLCVTAVTPPANDNPCNAIALPALTTTCNYTTANTVNASLSTTGIPAPSCIITPQPDVWFSLTVPSTGALSINTQSGTMTDGVMAVYTGSCNSLTEIACQDNGINMPQIPLSGLTPGATIWIRVWGYSSTSAGTFGICATVVTPPPPVTNDNHCSSTFLSATSSCNYITYTTTGSTSNTGVPNPGCGGTVANDIWFQAVVPPSGSLFINTTELGMTDAAMAAYSGPCNNLTLIECSDDVNNLMPALSLSFLFLALLNSHMKHSAATPCP
jgi:hypothetical protein